jgi:hypothetical protein
MRRILCERPFAKTSILTAILSSYTEERGYPPYHPTMIVMPVCL